MNMEVYLGVKTKLVLGSEGAIEELSSKTKYDLILTLAMIGKEPTTKNIENHLKSYGKKIPLIITGTVKDEVIKENVIGIAGKYQIQSILKTGAKILEITAKQMAQLDVGAYYPISIAPLLNFTKAPCMLFTKDGSDYKKMALPEEAIKEELNRLNSTGLKDVYVKSSDRLVVINKISMTLIEQITETLKDLEGETVEKKVQVLSDGFEFAAANLFSSDEIKKQMQEIASAAASVMADVARENATVKSLMSIMLSNRDGYIFTHSMIISYVAYHMIKNVTWGGEGQVEKINFVLFFHDIFLAPIYLKHPELRAEAALLENPNLDEKEKDIILNHAKLAAELVVGYKRCPMGADILIKQHHGMKKGKGFVKIYMEDLSPLSKILLIAEMFVEELMKANDEKREFNVKIAIPKLVSQFKSSSYTKMVNSLINVPI